MRRSLSACGSQACLPCYVIVLVLAANSACVAASGATQKCVRASVCVCVDVDIDACVDADVDVGADARATQNKCRKYLRMSRAQRCTCRVSGRLNFSIYCLAAGTACAGCFRLRCAGRTCHCMPVTSDSMSAIKHTLLGSAACTGCAGRFLLADRRRASLVMS